MLLNDSLSNKISTSGDTGQFITSIKAAWSQAYNWHLEFSTQNGENHNVPIGYIGLISSGNYTDYDKTLTTGTYAITYGLCNVAGVTWLYVSFDVNWIRMQFRAGSGVIQGRVMYGGTVGTWSTL